MFKNIHWRADKSLDSAFSEYDTEIQQPILVSKEQWSDKIPIKSGDRLAIIHNSEQVFMSVQLNRKQNSTRQIMRKLYDGVRRSIPKEYSNVITPNYRNQVYYDINRHVDTIYIEKLTEKFHDGKLTELELMGDHKYFEGMRFKTINGTRYLIPYYGS